MKKIISLLICGALAFSLCACKSNEPEKNAATAELKIVYDSAYSTYDSSVVSAYENLCRAVMAGEKSVRLNLGLSEKVMRLFYTSFPLSTLVESLTPAENGEGFEIGYKLGESEHKKAVNDFCVKINSILGEIQSYNKNIYAINAYHYVASDAKVSRDSAIDCYNTVMKGEGTSFSYAQLLAYLLLLGGVPACYVVASDVSNASWGLVQAQLNENWYFLDPLGEFYDNKGEQLRFFGMTAKDIKNTGLSHPVYSDDRKAVDSSSLYFDALRICKSYEIKENSLLVTTFEENVVKIEL